MRPFPFRTWVKPNLCSMLSIDSVYWVFFITGLSVGFGHCVGMCGPIVVSFSLNLRDQRRLFPHYLYHAGRITTYSLLGGLTGLTGSFTTVTSQVVGIQKWVMISTGILIIVMAIGMGGWLRFGRFFPNDQKSGGLFSKTFKKACSLKTTAAYFPVGMLLGLFPCGAVYTALIAAARNGMDAPSPLTGFWSGAALMTAFGAGTVPSLLVVGKLSNMKWLKKRETIYRAGAFVMMALGLYFIVKGIRY